MILTSLLLNRIAFKRGNNTNNAVSELSPFHVSIYIPFSGYRLKHSGVLSIIIILDNYLPNFLKSFP